MLVVFVEAIVIIVFIFCFLEILFVVVVVFVVAIIFTKEFIFMRTKLKYCCGSVFARLEKWIKQGAHRTKGVKWIKTA